MDISDRPITDRQLKYLNILLDRCFGDNRKLYLDLFYHIDSSKRLSLLQASEIIEKFVDENKDKDKNVDMDGCGSFIVAEAKTLEDAIEKANKHMEEEEVEYGLNIILKKSKS